MYLAHMFTISVSVLDYTPLVLGQHTSVLLYTDLIHTIGRTKCDSVGNETLGESDEIDLKSIQGILLSNRKFFEVTKPTAVFGSCEYVAISAYTFERFNWTCFTSGNTTKHVFNWLFVDCDLSNVLSLSCLTFDKFKLLLSNLCDETPMKKTCTEFQMYERNVWCSKNFQIEKIYHRVTPMSEPGGKSL